MNRDAFLELVRQQLGGSATPMAAQLALNAVLQGIKDGLTQEGNIKLAGFGTFRVQKRAPRKLLLPGSQTSIQLPERDVVTFSQAPPRS